MLFRSWCVATLRVRPRQRSAAEPGLMRPSTRRSSPSFARRSRLCRSLTGALVQCPRMTKLLTEVIRQIVELPEDRQDDAARVLMLMLEHDPEQYRLSDEQLREVDEAIADVDAGNFASERDIDRVLHRSWA